MLWEAIYFCPLENGHSQWVSGILNSLHKGDLFHSKDSKSHRKLHVSYLFNGAFEQPLSNLLNIFPLLLIPVSEEQWCISRKSPIEEMNMNS